MDNKIDLASGVINVFGERKCQKICHFQPNCKENVDTKQKTVEIFLSP